MAKIHIVLDIDNVLADRCTLINREFHFLRNGAVLSVNNHLYYIFPGIIPLLKRLYSYDNVEVSFFSSGTKVRDKELIKKLLILALGEGGYQLIKPTLIVRSKDDQTLISSRVKVKDLLKIVNVDDLPRTIFVDDEFCFEPQQAHNFLKSQKVSANAYSEDMGDDSSDYRWQRVNNAYYLAGRLIQLINFLSADPSNTVSNCLFPIQFNNDSSGGYLFNMHVYHDRAIYEYGLAMLQAIDPSLTLVSADFYRESIETIDFSTNLSPYLPRYYSSLEQGMSVDVSIEEFAEISLKNRRAYLSSIR
ncbi:hypothetical protein [Candidatus Berkiella aquae]|uniref:NLI interacting factor-like phosphatase n=1 Tax=Candidatus Berkiella aquae TaxID=295108 RepID=A0A0Q9YLK9_9GAMM|nr:hypothetical protein [Candidatus Berkiella aquae]MCS5711510.1 hypothetical protein [Candidatus Berkiella aquae]